MAVGGWNFGLETWFTFKSQPYILDHLARCVNEKLSPRFYGLFKVFKMIGVVSYKLLLPETSRLHPIFHISQLKKAPPISQPSQELPLFL